MNIEQAKTELLKGRTLSHLDLEKPIRLGSKLEVFEQQYSAKNFQEGWSIVYANKGQQKKAKELEKLKFELVSATATIDNQNKELAELDITLKSKDLQLQQVVQELQEVEEARQRYQQLYKENRILVQTKLIFGST